MMRLFALLLVLACLPAYGGSIEDALAHPDRIPADVARDPRSKPEAVIPLLNLQAGEHVVDIFAGGGYYSELLARLVGPSGKSVLQNNRGFRGWGINELTDRFDNRSVPGLVQLDSELADLKLGREQFDAALLVMALHDMYVVPKRYNGEAYVPVGKPADVDGFLIQIFDALKPGARFVVVDHAASAQVSRDDAFELHRIHEDFARSEVERRGFVFVDSSDALRHETDDGTRIVFDSDLKGRTDRFVHAFEKPAD